MDTRTHLQNALRGHHVPELVRMQLRPVYGRDNQPVIMAGNHAVVARMQRSDGGKRALRVPITAEIGRTWPDRYRAIADGMPPEVRSYLPQAIEIPARGITLGGRHVPAVVMEWIDGPTLLAAADRAAARGNRAVLRALADAVREMGQALEAGDVTHGDLAADNIVVRSTGDLVCIDLDRLTWPDGPPVLLGEVSAAYRHPGRGASAAEQDAFSLLVLYASLLALADAPDLRERFGDAPDRHGGALLFSAWDLADPSMARAFIEARERVLPATREVLDELRAACRGNPGRAATAMADVFEAPAPPEPVAAEPVARSSGWDLSRVIDRLKDQYARTPETIDTIVTPIPPTPQPRRQEPPTTETLEADRELLRFAIEDGNEADVVRLAARLGDDPVARMHRLDVERVLSRGYGKRIADASGSGRDETVIALAREARDREIPLDAPARKAVRLAGERMEVREKLSTALGSNDRATLAELAVSGELVVLGDTDRSSLQRVLQALEWPSLQRALEADDDALILATYDQELFESGAALPEEVQERLALARERQSWLGRTRAALKARDLAAIERLVELAPPGAMDRLSESERARIERMTSRKRALARLRKAIQSGNDGRILQAMHEVERVGARIDDAQTWTVIQRVVERAGLVEQIMEAATADPVDDRRLARLLPVAKMMAMQDHPAFAGETSWDVLEGHVARGAALRRIRRAIERGDPKAIRGAAFPDITGAVEMLSPREREIVERSRRVR